MTPEQEQEALDALARAIKLQAQAAFEEMMTRINAGETPRDAIEAVTAQFSGQYYAELSAAFSAVLDSAIGIADIKQWPVGDVALSKHLYRHTAQVNAVTRQLIQNQTKGFVQMRELAMQIYEGYRFKDDPLKVKAKLPKYLREALRDPAIDGGFARIVAQIRVNQLKTPALKAAYSQMLDALEQEAGAARLKNLLRTAWYERNRYFANRIAQTELHRAYSNQVAQEIMEDDEAVWVKIMMSPTHPKVDQCDYHAGLNAWGMGPGVYPKALAPKPPFHPHCRCVASVRYELDADAPQTLSKDAPQRFMNRLSPYDQRLIAGSRARLEAFKNGRSLESIYNAATRPEYRWRKLGDPIYNGKRQEQSRPVKKQNPLDVRAEGMLTTLAARAVEAQPNSASGLLENLWTRPDLYRAHIAKRLGNGDISDETDYALKTFSVLASAQRMTMAIAKNDFASGKIQIEAQGWIVLVGNDGHIMTSHPFDPEKKTFETRHKNEGDIIHDHVITPEIRKILKGLFSRY